MKHILINNDHKALANIGTNTHAQIDTHIAGTGTSVHGDSYVLNTGDTMTGALTITPTADSTAVLKVTNAANTATLFNVDSTNEITSFQRAYSPYYDTLPTALGGFGPNENWILNSGVVDLDNNWSAPVGATVTFLDAVSPTGETNAHTITFTTTTGVKRGGHATASFIASKTCCFSIWMKTDSGTLPVRLKLCRTNDVNVIADTTFTVTSNWRRYYITGTYDSTTAAAGEVRICADGETGTIRVYGVQVNSGTQPTPYLAIYGGENVTTPRYGLTSEGTGIKLGSTYNLTRLAVGVNVSSTWGTLLYHNLGSIFRCYAFSGAGLQATTGSTGTQVTVTGRSDYLKTGFIMQPTVDNHQVHLYVDGDDSYKTKLAVKGPKQNGFGGDVVLTAQEDGKIGIGTTSPGELLHLYSTTDADAILETVANGDYSALFFRRGRANGTIVQDGNVLGTLIFKGQDGAGYEDAGYINCEVDGTPSNGTDMPGRLTFWTSPDGSSTPVERVRITSAGNVGIGTTSPGALLDVAGSGSPMAIFGKANSGGNNGVLITNPSNTANSNTINIFRVGGSSAGDPYLLFDDGPTTFNWSLGVDNSDSDKFKLSNSTALGTSDKFTITTDGNVGIGTTAPLRRLDINEASGNCLRLIYNDSDGSAANYADFLVSSSGDLTITPSGGDMVIGTTIRAATAAYRRYYHIVLGAANPGASGSTWVVASANTTGGWRLTNAAWLLRGQADIHADWDAVSDLKFGVNFMVNVDNTAGGVGDTVDLKATIYYKGVGDTATKSQVVEVATTVGQSAQYKQFRAEFTIDYDAVSNVVEVGDVISIILNLETDTSEVDDIVVTSMEFYYNTTHIGIESGDV